MFKGHAGFRKTTQKWSTMRHNPIKLPEYKNKEKSTWSVRQKDLLVKEKLMKWVTDYFGSLSGRQCNNACNIH